MANELNATSRLTATLPLEERAYAFFAKHFNLEFKDIKMSAVRKAALHKGVPPFTEGEVFDADFSFGVRMASVDNVEDLEADGVQSYELLLTQ